jgi:hypothetical protein
VLGLVPFRSKCGLDNNVGLGLRPDIRPSPSGRVWHLHTPYPAIYIQICGHSRIQARVHRYATASAPLDGRCPRNTHMLRLIVPATFGPSFSSISTISHLNSLPLNVFRCTSTSYENKQCSWDSECGIRYLSRVDPDLSMILVHFMK